MDCICFLTSRRGGVMVVFHHRDLSVDCRCALEIDRSCKGTATTSSNRKRYEAGRSPCMSEWTFDESSMTPSSFSLARILTQSSRAFCKAISVPAATVKLDVDVERIDSRAPGCSLIESKAVELEEASVAVACAARIAFSNLASKRMVTGIVVAACESFPVQPVDDFERKDVSDTTWPTILSKRSSRALLSPPPPAEEDASRNSGSRTSTGPKGLPQS
mmetsp:Transcript_32116/g.94525  ORF Transcript_32116/g.94525 Transcript_32116/m.94525 type:complete len:218 (-) Transcript_32116:944-1597(-)